VKITAWCAAAGAFIGVVTGVVLHVLVWRPSGPVGFVTFGRPRRYVDYLPVGGGPRETVRLHFGTTDGWHAAWWPLLPATVGTGLITGALIGAVVLAYRSRPTQ
jgi:hypothetical protein